MAIIDEWTFIDWIRVSFDEDVLLINELGVKNVNTGFKG